MSASVPGRSNNLGFLRVFFAALVVVGHSPDMLDLPPSRELLRGTFGTLTMGEVAVDAFFIISGYLITKSFLSPQPLSRFLTSRVLRIYPGYIVAFLISFYIVGWFGGGDLGSGLGWGVVRQIATMGLLAAPNVHDVFTGLAIPSVNGPMWSLAQEFRCYVLVAILGLAGLLRQRGFILGMLIVGLGLLTFPSFAFARMVSVFTCGMAFYVFRDRIFYHWAIACVAALAWVALLPFHALCEPATGIFGGYLIFWFAFSVRIPGLDRIGRKRDVSYGLYLYAWPIANLIIQRHPEMSPWTLTAITIPLAAACGYLSWVLIEHPALKFKDDPRLLARVEQLIAFGARLCTRLGLRRLRPSGVGTVLTGRTLGVTIPGNPAAGSN